MTNSLIDLRATVAMRTEDRRIATKHREQAAARTMSRESLRAYLGACKWEATCAERERRARVALIAAQA